MQSIYWYYTYCVVVIGHFDILVQNIPLPGRGGLFCRLTILNERGFLTLYFLENCNTARGRIIERNCVFVMVRLITSKKWKGNTIEQLGLFNEK